MGLAAMRADPLNNQDLNDAIGCSNGLIIVAVDVEAILAALVTLDSASINGTDDRIINFLADIIDSIAQNEYHYIVRWNRQSRYLFQG